MCLVVAGPQFMPFSNAQLAAPSPPVPHVNNPWSQTTVQSAVTSPSPALVTAAGQSKVSDAEVWLNSTASQIDPFAAVPNVAGKPASHRPRVVNGSGDVRPTGQMSPHGMTAVATVHHQTSATKVDQQSSSFISTPVRAGEQNYSFAAAHPPGIQTVNTSHPFLSNQSGVRTADSQPFDSTFDSAWAARSSNRSIGSASAPVNNPFQTSVDKVMPAFEVKL